MVHKLKSAQVFSDRSFPLSCLRIERHTSTRLHSHEFHELVVILAGRGRHVTDSGSYPLAAGDVFLIRGDTAHGYGHVSAMSVVNILFDPRRLHMPMADIRSLPGYHALFRIEPRLRVQDPLRNRFRLPPPDLAEAARLIALLESELQKRRPGYQFLATARLMELIGHLSRCCSRLQRPEERPLLSLGKVLGHIEAHFAEQIAVADLTRIAGMSESTLMRMFRKVMGRSPIEHLIRVRVARACELLQRSGSRVTEAAFQCGFNDSNYFSRQFHKVVGCSPRTFKSRARLTPSRP